MTVPLTVSTYVIFYVFFKFNTANQASLDYQSKVNN